MKLDYSWFPFFNLVPVAGVRKNFFQFVIHHVDADLFLELYVEWNIISVVGHELLGAGFDQIFDDLDKTNDEEIIAAAVEILLELVAEIDEAADTFDHLVQHAVDKLLELLQ